MQERCMTASQQHYSLAMSARKTWEIIFSKKKDRKEIWNDAWDHSGHDRALYIFLEKNIFIPVSAHKLYMCTTIYLLKHTHWLKTTCSQRGTQKTIASNLNTKSIKRQPSILISALYIKKIKHTRGIHVNRQNEQIEDADSQRKSNQCKGINI